MKPAVFTLDETCDLFKVRRCTLYRWIDRGELRAVKLGKRTFIPVAEIERVLSATMPEKGSARRLADAPKPIRQKKTATQPESIEVVRN